MARATDEHVVRRSARAILLDGGDLVLIKRTRPNSAPYWVTIGGGREPQDADLAGTVRREAMEEAAADLHVVMQVLVLTDHHPGRRTGCHLGRSAGGERYGRKCRWAALVS